MRHLIAVIFIAAGMLGMQAQDAGYTASGDIQVGEILEIGPADSARYAHIDFPRANFIIKRGGIANYRGLQGNRVVVTSIDENKNGQVQVKIKRADGGRFFGSHSSVSADLQEALQSGELRKI